MSGHTLVALVAVAVAPAAPLALTRAPLATPAWSPLATPARRAARPAMYAAPEEPLDREELQAIAGVWQVQLALDEGARNVTFHLSVGRGIAPGKVTALDTLAHSIRSYWAAHAVPGGKQVEMRVQLGPWMLEGRGERDGGDDGGGLRVGALTGAVLEGEDDPFCCGSFRARCSLPATDDEALPALEARHRARVEARPAPPTLYEREGFEGRWEALVAFDDAPPAMLPLVLNATDRTFRSEPRPGGGGGELVGSWGVWSPRREGSKQLAAEARGTHLWLRADRERSTQASGGGGLGGLPTSEGFSMWGTPVPLSLEAELRGRAESMAATGGVGRAERVDGQTYYGTGSAGRVLTGRFSLSRAPDEFMA